MRKTRRALENVPRRPKQERRERVFMAQDVKRALDAWKEEAAHVRHI